MNKVTIQFFGFLFVLLLVTQAVAQERKHLERKWARAANISALDSNFAQADTLYRRSLLIRDFDTNRYNLALALMGQEQYAEAEKEWKHLLKQSEDNRLRSLVAYNASHCALSQEKIDKAKEYLKTALRERGDNAPARHNLWLLMSRPEPPEQENQDDQGGQDNQEDQESQDKQENQDDQEGQDNQEDQESQDKQENQDDQESKDDQERDSGKESDQAEEDKENKEGETGSEDDPENSEEEQESENSEENEDESEEEKNEDKSSPSDEASGGEEENRDAMQEGTVSGEINPQDAQRLLQAIEEAEAQTRERVRKKEWKGKEKNNEKDW